MSRSSRTKKGELPPMAEAPQEIPKANDIEVMKESTKEIKTQDKRSFALGIVSVVLAAFLTGSFTSEVWWMYSLSTAVLMGIRISLFVSKKWGYFLLDYCYFANLMLLLYLHVWPNSCFLFHLNFAFTVGPLGWAIVYWQNSMVFHSLTQMTTLFVHIMPPLVIWTLRWFPSNFNTCSIEGPLDGFLNLGLYPLLMYCFWQVLYFIKVQVLDRHKFKNDPEYTTSYLWLVEREKRPENSVVCRLSMWYGKRWRLYMFAFWQLIYTILTLIPVAIFYYSFWAHTLLLVYFGYSSFWNGANFYVEVFSVRYQEELEKKKQPPSNKEAIMNKFTNGGVRGGR